MEIKKIGVYKLRNGGEAEVVYVHPLDLAQPVFGHINGDHQAWGCNGSHSLSPNKTSHLDLVKYLRPLGSGLTLALVSYYFVCKKGGITGNGTMNHYFDTYPPSEAEIDWLEDDIRRQDSSFKSVIVNGWKRLSH